LLSAGTGATRVWVVAACPTTTESDVKDKPLGRKEGIDSAVIGRQKGIGSGPGIRIRVTRINIIGDRLALKVPYPKTLAVPLKSKYAPTGVDKALTEGALASIKEGTTCIARLRTSAVCIHYRSRESWTTINNWRLFWNTALLIRACVKRVLIPETGHETTTGGKKNRN